MLVFVDRSDVGGSGANDKATEYEDRMAIDVDVRGLSEAYSEFTSADMWRKFDMTVTKDALENGEHKAEMDLRVTTKGDSKFFTLDKSKIRFNENATASATASVATIVWENAVTVQSVDGRSITLSAVDDNIVANCAGKFAEQQWYDHR